VLASASSPARTFRKDCFRETRKPTLETSALPRTAAHDIDLARAAGSFCAQRSFRYLLSMPNELLQIDAEELKSRVRELRRFL
jgi:hypothetical protein